jgi:hypothetical protein
MMSRIFKAAVCALALLCAPFAAQGDSPQVESAETEMKIRIVADDHVLTGTLGGGVAARAFAAMLPLELNLEDYHGIEKIADLPARLPTDGEPAGVDPDVGDITYYAPWGNLAIFYRDFGYATGLVRLGRLEGALSALAGKGAVRVRIEPVDAAD